MKQEIRAVISLCEYKQSFTGKKQQGSFWVDYHILYLDMGVGLPES